MTKKTTGVVRVSRNYSLEEDTADPRLSVVVPCYGVAEHVHRLLNSLELQDCDPNCIEFIFVIDGSPDHTEDIVTTWMQTSKFLVTLIWQENRGVAGALNRGNQYSRGSLISTIGADDSLSQNYFSEILHAAAEYPDIAMFVARMIRLDSKGEPKSHPLDFKFMDVFENTVVDLGVQPELIHLAGGVLTLRRSVLEEHSLKYNEVLRTTFEDADLIARYLLQLPSPKYMLVPEAVYFYRMRAGSITSEASLDYTGKLNTARHAYEQLLDLAQDPCPRWLGNLILYELYWTFRAHANLNTSVYALPSSAQAEFDHLSRRLLKRIGLRAIREFRVITLSLDIRAAWEAAVEPAAVTHSVVRWAYDHARRLQKVSFYSARPEEEVSFRLNNNPAQVAYSHVREVLYFEKPWAYEHIYWVDTFDQADWQQHLQVDASSQLDFTDSGKVFGYKSLLSTLNLNAPKASGSANSLLPKRVNVAAKSEQPFQWDALIERLRLVLAYRAGGFLGWRKRFAGGWVLMDTKDQANDNAEHLYRYIQHNRPDINVWFVNKRGSADWRRLHTEGFRLISYGSAKHFALMKESAVLASSHLDHYVVQPFKKTFLPKTWLYSFLQHGVTKDRQDRWFNQKSIDHLVTSTIPETTSISGEPSPYKLSEREVTLTGMPRHDRLFNLTKDAKENRNGAQRVLVMPTWRRYLSPAASGVSTGVLVESEYAREWTGFLNSPYIGELIARPNVDVVLLPHRGSASYWESVDFTNGVQLASYVGDDIQELIASSTLVVTDYSSQAFEGAFCGIPSVYFQFDRSTFYSGGHVYSPGYFDYEAHGFGPVADDLNALTHNVELMLSGNHPNFDEYMRRVADLYPMRDNRACERVVAEIEKGFSHTRLINPKGSYAPRPSLTSATPESVFRKYGA